LSEKYGIFVFSAMISLGDTIICVDVRSHPADLLAIPLKEGQEYQCLGMKQCKCGAKFVDIGLSVSSNKYDVVCNCQRRFNDGIWWFAIERFKKKPDARQEVEMANEVLLYCLN